MIWHPSTLKSSRDILPRAIFRAFWLTVGYLISWPVFKLFGFEHLQHRAVFLIMAVVILFGIVGDWWRIRKKKSEG